MQQFLSASEKVAEKGVFRQSIKSLDFAALTEHTPRQQTITGVHLQS